MVSSPSAAVRSRVAAAAGCLRAALAARIAVDTRALAAFRVGLGALLIADLLRRSRSLVAFYTDAGVLPRRALFADYSDVYSVHALSGEAWAVAALFAVAGAVALALAVGYRTRVATVVSWLLLLSLHARNPMVLNAGDALLAMLLFWGAFLPLGARWSVDAVRRAPDDDARSAGRGSAVATAATAGVLLQLLVMYVTNALHKLEGDLWTSGEAVVYVMQADHFTYHLGNVLPAFPGLLRAFTFAWVALLFASPLLIALTGVGRAAVASLFVGMHLGMAATMRIDLFPIVSVVGFLPFYQAPVWDAAERALDRFGPTAAVEGARARLRSVGAAVASLDPSPPRSTPLDADRRSGLRARIGAGLGRCRRACSTALPAVFVALVLLSSAASVGYGEVPDRGEAVLDAVEMDQQWQMFAPDPIRSTHWFAAPAVLTNGTERDALRGGAVSFDRPPDVDATYPTARWRKYLSTVESTDNEKHRSYLAHYLCAEWNRTHATGVETVAVHHFYERTDPYNGTVLADGRFGLIEYDCSGPFVQSE
jgi:hypothetical protein